MAMLNPWPGGLNPVDRFMVELSMEEERLRLERFRRAWQAYEFQPNERRQSLAQRHPDTVSVNKSRVIVDKGVSFLFGKEVTFQLDETTTTPEEKYLELVWAQNRKMTLLQKAALNGAVCGQTFIRIVQRPAPLLPRLVILDPATVLPQWNDEDIDEVLAYRIQWSTHDPKSGRPVVRRQQIAKETRSWRITDWKSGTNSTRWEQIGTDVLWPHEWPPIVDCQNLPAPNAYWGYSDLEDDVLGLNANRDTTLSKVQRIIRFHAAPKTWAKGIGEGDLDESEDGMIILPSPDSAIGNLEMQSDLSSSLEMDRRLDEAIHEISRIPPIATGKLENVGALSAVAMQILFAPLIEKTETKQQTYGEMLTELNRRLLELGGFGADRRPRNVWPRLLPKNELEDRQAAVLDDSLKVASKETLSTKLGYDWKTESDRMEQEADAAIERAQDAFSRGQGAVVGAAMGQEPDSAAE